MPLNHPHFLDDIQSITVPWGLITFEQFSAYPTPIVLTSFLDLAAVDREKT